MKSGLTYAFSILQTVTLRNICSFPNRDGTFDHDAQVKVGWFDSEMVFNEPKVRWWTILFIASPKCDGGGAEDRLITQTISLMFFLVDEIIKLFVRSTFLCTKKIIGNK